MDDLRLLCFGDSFTAGVGDPEGRGWVGRVVAASFAAGRPLTAYALGVRRETSVEVAVRWRFEAHARLAPGAETRIVFAVGTNDTTFEETGPRVAPDRSCMALGTMLGQAATMRLPAAVVGPLPVGDTDQRERAVALSERFAAVCAERGAPYVALAPALSADPLWREQLAAGDGAHPAAAGYELLAGLLLGGGLLDWLHAAR